MEQPAGPGARSDGSGLDSIQFGEEIHHLISAPPDNASSFTALLELPPNQAMELLHCPDSSLGARPVLVDEQKPHPPPPPQRFSANLTFPSNSGLIERAARFSVFAGECLNNNRNNSPETSSVPSNSRSNPEKSVKSEPAETESFLNSTPPLVSDPTTDSGRQNQKSAKRKEREKKKKAKGSAKKSKSTEDANSGNGQNLPYVHFRVRRGQATDSHSLAERARREKINARMKLLQELVPGCNKISGTALVLDEIINHVQYLQRQVELLSMRLTAVNPIIDFNLDPILAAESGSLVGNDFSGIAVPVMWPELQVNGSRQQYNQQWHFDALHQPIWERQDDNHHFVAPGNPLLSYDDSANAASAFESIEKGAMKAERSYGFS